YRRKLLKHAASGAALAALGLGVVPACATDTASEGSDAAADADLSAESKLSITDEELLAMGFDPASLVEYQALDREYYPCWAVIDADLANASVTRGDSAELQKHGVVDLSLPLAVGHYVIFRWDTWAVIAVVRPE
ncbi:MAG: hypothetical protein VXX01_06265, partial [Pseudomonadota bacterium]|nr:hypothetical protein [Pseudomonadota bacterium]